MKWTRCLQNIYGMDSYSGNVPPVCPYIVSHSCCRGDILRVGREAPLLLRLHVQVPTYEGEIL